MSNSMKPMRVVLRISQSLCIILLLLTGGVLAWLRFRTVPIIPIIGARNASQLQDNLASLDLELSAEQLKSLDEASRVELGFPYDLYNTGMLRAFTYGGMRDRLLL